jgi:copper resistance protein B
MRRAIVGLLALVFASPTAVVAQHVHGEAATPAPAQTPAASAEPLPPFIPLITDADRAAAFPDVGDHEVHGASMHSLVLFDRLEWQSGTGPGATVVDARGWVGGDLDRLWFRADVGAGDGRVNDAQVQAFYGRAIARWWEVVAGVRQDFEPGPARTWAAIGIQGLAPYWFDVEATGYIGASGRTHVHLSAEYDLLLTNRLIIQSAASMDVFGKADRERNVGAGMSSIEAALRLRYEVRREFAPYLGVVWQRPTFGTAEIARSAGIPTGETTFVLGARIWF